jgi:trimeric autotransporter adhesin
MKGNFIRKLFFYLLHFIAFTSIGQSTTIVISEVYGGGGGSGATIPFKNDYVELYNMTNEDIEMKDWSIQYNSSAGTNNYQTNVFSGTIKAKSFFLIQLGGGTAGADLPEPDFIGTLNMSATMGRVALRNNNVPLPASNPAVGEGIVDFVGYGTAVTFEGEAAAIALTNVTALERKANANSTILTMSVDGADVQAGNGYDTNNNNLDFLRVSPNPQNTKSPAEGSSINNPSMIVSPTNIHFGNVGIGSVSSLSNARLITMNLSKEVTVVASPNFLLGKTSLGPFKDTLIFSVTALNGTTDIFLLFTPDEAIEYHGSIQFISSEIENTPSVALQGKGLLRGEYVFDFTNCVTTLSDGFTQYSVSGDQVWSCTSFGRDGSDNAGKASKPNGIQISGFQTIANENEDWLISPAITVIENSTLYPTLSFYSRTRFGGNNLTLKIATNYQLGQNPKDTTFIWEDLVAKFPSIDSDTWTYSDGIDLSKYRGMKIHLAWIYTSTTTEAARWTLDDIQIANEPNPPSGSISLSTKSIYFGYLEPNSVTLDSFDVVADAFTKDITISVLSPYILSTDGINFNQDIKITSVQNKINAKVFIRANPTIENTSFIDTAFVKISDSIISKIIVNSNTFDQSKTLDIVSYNIEWFGGINGPVNDSLQIENSIKLLKRINADVYGLTEIVDTSALLRLATSIGKDSDEYGYYVSKHASQVSNSIDTNYMNAQKLAFIYRKSEIKPIKIEPLFYTTDQTSAAYFNWASGRFPLLMNAEVTISGVRKEIIFILIHGKAQNSADAYSRRKNAAQSLYDYVTTQLKDKSVVILGDYNDDLDFTIGAVDLVGADWPASSYDKFTNDTMQFLPATLALSLAKETSTVGYVDVIDHIIMTKNLQQNFINNSAQILDEFANSLPNYSTTTSDHFPVKVRLRFESSTNIEQVLEDELIYVYPNPSTGFYLLETNGSAGIFQIFDLNGRMLKSLELNQQIKIIDLEDLKSGAYLGIWKSNHAVKKLNLVKL